jgi:sialic acid synthase SpsE
METRFIAEVGSNHNGELDRALNLISVAKDIGCWGVKFQLYTANQLYEYSHPNYRQAEERQLKPHWLPVMKQYAIAKHINIGYSFFDPTWMSMYHQYSDFLKIASHEAGLVELYRTALVIKKPLFVSIGLMDETELFEMLAEIQEDEIDLTIMHCVSKYPAAVKECNLAVIEDFCQRYPDCFKMGWSDHTKNRNVIYGAVAAGAEYIEAHFDLDDNKGAESVHGHCWSASFLESAITGIRVQEEAWGTPNFDIIRKQQTERYLKADPGTGLRGRKVINEG